MKTQPGLAANRPQGTSSVRAAASSHAVIESYFIQLLELYEKYHLTYSMERIHDIDEKEFDDYHCRIQQ